jgi:HEPN domain-containing protein
MYGYEAELIPASDLFSREDAEEAFTSTEEVFEACNRLIEEISGKKLDNQD